MATTTCINAADHIVVPGLSTLDYMKNSSRNLNLRKISVIYNGINFEKIGKITNEAHKLLGDYAKEIADEVISVGKLAKMYETKIHFNEPEEASDYLLGKIQQDDIILVKASRALGLEKIVEALKK